MMVLSVARQSALGTGTLVSRNAASTCVSNHSCCAPISFQVSHEGLRQAARKLALDIEHRGTHHGWIKK